jgi:hypothetical protein
VRPIIFCGSVLLYHLEPRDIGTINVFQRHVKQCIVRVHSCVGQILLICNRRRGDNIGEIAHRLVYSVVCGCVAKCDRDSRWDESMRTVGWVCRVGTMREQIREECFEIDSDEGLWIQGTKFRSPELQRGALVESYPDRDACGKTVQYLPESDSRLCGKQTESTA